MQSRDLIKVWTAPANTKLTPKQISIRLPLHVAVKIEALCEMFPNRTKTEIIGDLLSTALEDVTEGFSTEPYSDEEAHAASLGLDVGWGDRGRYNNLVEKYLKEMDLSVGESQNSATENTESNREKSRNRSSRTADVGGPGATAGRRSRIRPRKK